MVKRVVAGILFGLFAINVGAATLLSDNFDSGVFPGTNWTVTGVGAANLNTRAVSSSPNSLELSDDEVFVTSLVMDTTSSTGLQFDVWIRRGDDSFSENPDNNEDLEVQYFNSSSTWVTLETFPGQNSPPITGEIFVRSYALPAAAMHANFRIRFHFTQANAPLNSDVWHIDDVVVSDSTATGEVTLGICDDFDSGVFPGTDWTVTTGTPTGDADVVTYTSSSAPNSLMLHDGEVFVTSLAIDTSTKSSIKFNVWIRRGGVFGGGSSDDSPDAGEDLEVQYLNSSSTWVTLETFAGGGTAGEIFTRSYTLPSTAQHANLQIRFHLVTANGPSGYDPWHVDDVCLTGIPAPIAYYRMDETWTVPTADVVLDYSGNGNHADTISSGGTTVSNDDTTPVSAGSPGTCGYGVFPNNTNNNIEAIDTNYTPGNQGSITFWYNSNEDWITGNNRLLFDASRDLGATEDDDRHFFLVRRTGNNGSLRFVVEDTNDTKLQAQVNDLGLTYGAGDWVHIGVTWDLPNNIIEIYVNGTLVATDTAPATNGVMGNIQDLYLGDQRDTGTGGNGWSNDSTNGLLDEVRIYDSVISQPIVDADRTSTHPCTLIDHYQISVASGDPGTCSPVQIEITAHNVIDAATNVDAATVLSFSTSSGTGTWGTKINGTGTWTPSGSSNGVATYTWPGGESSLKVNFSHGTAVTLNINLSDGSVTELKGDALEDPDITFSSSPIIRITSDGSSEGSIATEISGKDSDVAPSQTLYIQLKQSGITVAGLDGCEVPGFYNGVWSVSVAAECIDPATCAGKSVTVENNLGTATTVNTYNSGSVPVSVASWTPVNMNFDGTNGINITTDNKASLVFNYPDAGKMVLHFSTTMNPTATPASQTPSRTFAGSSNEFVVRPFGFRIDDFRVNGSINNNPAATDSAGGVFTKAGQDFTADITTVVWQSGDDTNFDGVPDSNSVLSSGTPNPATPNFGNETTPALANISHTLVAPVNASAQQGTLTGSGNVSGFAAGIVNNHTMSWNEVGIIQLDIKESNNNYLGGGQNVIGQIPYLGRFTPANLTVQTLGSANFDDSCSTGNFTYLDQTFYFGPAANDAPRIRVRGVDIDGNVTMNYDSDTGSGGFWKLNSTTLPRTYTDAAGAAATLDPPIAGVTQDTDVTYQNTGNYNGFVNLRLDRGSNGDPFVYQRESPEGPFNASVNLTFNAAGLIDDDGVCYDGDGDGICDGTTPTPLSTDDDFLYGTITGTELRFGRLNIGTAVGSELLPISVPFQAEYHDGAGFVINTDDDCTLIDDVSPANGIPDLVLDNNIESTVTDGDIQICATGGTSTFTLTNPTLVGGDGVLSFSAPGTACKGYTGITLDLATLGLGHLLYDWSDADGLENGPYSENPSGRVDFGLYEGPRSYIYIREPWP